MVRSSLHGGPCTWPLPTTALPLGTAASHSPRYSPAPAAPVPSALPATPGLARGFATGGPRPEPVQTPPPLSTHPTSVTPCVRWSPRPLVMIPRLRSACWTPLAATRAVPVPVPVPSTRVSESQPGLALAACPPPPLSRWRGRCPRQPALLAVTVPAAQSLGSHPFSSLLF